MNHATDFVSAKKIHNCLLKFIEQMSKSPTPWFAIHSAQFGVVIVLTLLNPLIPDSAIWHKMQSHAQYSVNLYEICTAKRS